MKLSVWTYEGPPHVGAMRVATGMKGLHYVLHAPQGDTYADLLFTMIERRDHRPPVTYTTFQARDLGADTANLFKTALQAAYDRFQPQAMIVGASCTAELIQDDPGGMAETMGIPVPIVRWNCPPISGKRISAPTRPSSSWSGRWRGPVTGPTRGDQRQSARAHRTRLSPPRRRGRDHPDAGRNGRRGQCRRADGGNAEGPRPGCPRRMPMSCFIPRPANLPAASSSASMACPTPRPCRSGWARRAISWPSWAGCWGSTRQPTKPACACPGGRPRSIRPI
jgi:hypothetical protein